MHIFLSPTLGIKYSTLLGAVITKENKNRIRKYYYLSDKHRIIRIPGSCSVNNFIFFSNLCSKANMAKQNRRLYPDNVHAKSIFFPKFSTWERRFRYIIILLTWNVGFRSFSWTLLKVVFDARFQKLIIIGAGHHNCLLLLILIFQYCRFKISEPWDFMKTFFHVP